MVSAATALAAAEADINFAVIHGSSTRAADPKAIGQDRRAERNNPPKPDLGTKGAFRPSLQRPRPCNARHLDFGQCWTRPIM